jgi:hypothetical protein
MEIVTKQLLALVLSFSLVKLPLARARPAMVSTAQVVADLTRPQGEATVADFLTRGEVARELQRLGVSSADVADRLAGLSDREEGTLAEDIRAAKVGGDIGGILLVVFLVLGIIYFAKRI